MWQRRRRWRDARDIILESLEYYGIKLRATNHDGNLRYPMRFFRGEPPEGYKFHDNLTFLAKGDDEEINGDFVKDFGVNVYCPTSDFIKEFKVTPRCLDSDYTQDFEVNVRDQEKDFIKDFDITALPSKNFVKNFNIIVHRFRDVPPGEWVDVIFADGQFVVLGIDGRTITSKDGYHWTMISGHENVRYNNILTSMRFSGIAHRNGLYVAVGDWGAAISANLASWTIAAGSASGIDVAYGNNSFVTVGGIRRDHHAEKYHAMARSNNNGRNWSRVSLPPGYITDYVSNLHYFHNIIRGGNMFVAIGGKGLASSSNGSSWAIRTVGGQPIGIDGAVAYGDGRFVTISGSRVVTSTNAISWTVRNNISGGGIFSGSLVYGDGKFVGLGFMGVAISDNGGENWEFRHQTVNPPAYRSSAYGNGVFVGVGRQWRGDWRTSNAISVSPDGKNWTNWIVNWMPGIPGRGRWADAVWRGIYNN